VTDIDASDIAALKAEENEQIAQRKLKLKAMRESAVTAYPNGFVRDALAKDIIERFDAMSAQELEAQKNAVHMAGRIMTRRIMGKASFTHIQDMSGKMQLYVARDNLPEGVYQQFKTWDLGDIIAVRGHVFKTKTGELSVKVSDIQLVTKALRPLPDKYHGLHDQEQRFRQRYLDLIVNEKTRRIFTIRSKLISAMRRYFDEHGFMEVETPMMHSQPGGATAKPFTTHHNALDMELYMRIAPELFLKRLVVGGIERVYEINRNFRNEGISTRHNPEFTMLEFYQAYATYEDLMTFSEHLLRALANEVLGTTQLHWYGHDLDLSKPFVRAPMKQLILQYDSQASSEQLDDLAHTREVAKRHGIDVQESWGLGKLHMELFEAVVEHHIVEPTFVTEFPAEVSPLARANDDNPFITDRFELYVCGQEIANGFSELNDPEDQAQRFQAQIAAKEAGDDEAMSYDEDYIVALEHGLPPTAGEGIGIDRLVMLFSGASSIREVILFPLLRNK